MALCVMSCGGKKGKSHDAIKYTTMVVGRKDMTLDRQYSARMTGRQIVEVTDASLSKKQSYFSELRATSCRISGT